MPPRKTPGQALMDSLLEMGIDSLRETIQTAFSAEQMFQPQSSHLPRFNCNASGCQATTQSACMSCKRPYCARHSEWRRADGFVICHRCFQFLWASGKEAAHRGSWDAFQRANGQYARGPMPPPVQPGPPPPPPPPPQQAAPRPREQAPWEVLGIEPDATEEQIKKAYRSVAARCHPDAVPAEERDAAKEAFIRASTAYDAMLSALKASQR